MEALSAAAAAVPRADEQSADPPVAADDAERGWLPSDDEPGPSDVDDEVDALAPNDPLGPEEEEEEGRDEQQHVPAADAAAAAGTAQHGSVPPELPPDIKTLKDWLPRASRAPEATLWQVQARWRWLPGLLSHTQHTHKSPTHLTLSIEHGSRSAPLVGSLDGARCEDVRSDCGHMLSGLKILFAHLTANTSHMLKATSHDCSLTG